MQLTEDESTTLVRELRSYVRRRGIGDPVAAHGELAAELSADPTYAYNPAAFDAALERENQRIERLSQDAAHQGDPYFVLADQIEQTGQLDLTESGTRKLVTEVVADTGWKVGGDPLDEPPADMHHVVHVVQAVDAHRVAGSAFGSASVHAIGAPTAATMDSRPDRSVGQDHRGTSLGD